MNLFNEKNALLNSVSRVAVDVSARATAKFVSRRVMAVAALTVATFAMVDAGPAVADCSPNTTAVDGAGGGVTCGTNTAGGFDSDGYDSIRINVNPDGVAQGAAGKGTNGVGIDLTSGTDGSSDNNVIVVFNNEFGGTNAGQVIGTAGDGIIIQGDNNKVYNGGADTVGGGSITGTDDGIDIDSGTGNVVTNVNNGGGGATTTGLIQGNDSGVEVSSTGTNTINNGVSGSGTATIQGNNQGILVNGGGTLDIHNGAKGAITSTGNGMKIDADGAQVTLDGAGGSVTGGSNGVNITDDNVTFTMSGTNTITANGGNGINIVNDGGDSATNVTLNLNGGTIDANGGGDGIHVDNGETGATINIDGTSVGTSSDRAGDDGIDLNETATVNVKSGGVYANDWGIEINDTDAGGSDINVGNGTGTADAVVDGNSGGILISGGGLLGTDNVDVTVNSDGVVQSTNGPGIQVNTNGQAGDSNEIVVDGAVQSTNGTGIIVNGQSLLAHDNSVTVNDSGLVSGGNVGVQLLGDGDALDGSGNDLNNEGIVTGANIGVQVSNSYSDVDNSDGTINGTNGVGVQFDAVHLGGGGTESGYQSDANSVINAGTDGIRYTVNGGSGNEGGVNEVVANSGTINAGDDGIDVGSKFDVTNNGKLYSTSASTASSNGIELNGSDNNATNTGEIKQDKGGDGIHANADNQLLISNDGAGASILATGGTDADGIYVKNGNVTDYLTGGGAEQKVQNVNGASIVADDNAIEAGNFTVVYNGAGSTLAGDKDGDGTGAGIKVGNQNTVTNAGTINGQGDGIIAGNLNGIGWGGITNDASIDVDGSGIIVGNLNEVTNSATGTIVGGESGIVVNGTENIVTNDGSVEGGTGAGIQINGSSNIVTGNGPITSTADSNGDGVQINNASNNVVTVGSIQGDDDGVEISNGSNNNLTATTITGTNGDGVYITGGSNNTVTASGAITGDPGVNIVNSSNNTVTGASITGTNGGAIISNGTNNTVTTTTSGIDGGTGDGVGVTGSSNVVTSAAGIVGSAGVDIDGSGNIIGATGGITGNTGIGIEIDGSNNSVTASGATGHVTSDWTGGTGDAAVDVSGSGNTVTVGGHIHGTHGTGVAVNGTSNTIHADSYIQGLDGHAGVTITGTTNNVSGSSILGTDGGVVITNGTGSVVSATNGNIDGNTDADGDGVGVSITGSTNNVSALGAITGQGGVSITGSSNIVNSASIDGSVGTGTGDGVNIAGSTNTVTTGAITGDGDGIEITSGTGNVINATTVTGNGGSGAILGSGNTLNAGGAITGSAGSGVVVSGNSHVNGATTITGSTIGADINGNGNSVSASGLITGNAGDGVDIDGSTNTVDAGAVQGSADGVNINGSTNNVTVAGDITGTGSDGVEITSGQHNTVTAGDDITGENGNGVTIASDNNTVSADDNITGSASGVVLSGDNNTVTAGNNITGEDGYGADISGDSNTVEADDIDGTAGGVYIGGDSNNVTANGDVKATDGDGVHIDGGDNTVHVDDTIEADGDGLVLHGDDNNVYAGAIDVEGNGVVIDADDNDVEIGDTINAGLNGVWIQGGSGNSIDLRDVAITAGEDGIQLDNPNNHVDTDADTSITADDDGVELNYGGTTTVPQEFTWNGTINAKDDGINAIGGYMSIINNGTINADTDHTGGGDGIEVGNYNRVYNSSTGVITGNNGIVAGDNFEITNDGQITATVDGINAGSDGVIENNGTITAGDDGIEAGSNNEITNTSSLTINADDDGIVAVDGNVITNTGIIHADVDGHVNTTDGEGDGDGIHAGNGNQVSNEGLITGWNGIVVNNGNVVVNDETGVIQAENVGIQATDNNHSSDGTFPDPDSSTPPLFGIVNAGEIDAGNIGVDLGSNNDFANSGEITAGNIGIDATSLNFIVNVNSVEATNAGSVGVQLGNGNVLANVSGASISGDEDGVATSSNGNYIINAGTITGAEGDGADLTGNNNKIDNNAGTISGADNGVEISGNTNTVNNVATITGLGNDGVDVQSGTGNKIYNTGSVTGHVDGVEFETGGNFLYNNDGSVIGTTGNGVTGAEGSNTVTNSDTIRGAVDGVNLSGNSNDVYNYSGAAITGTADDGIDLNGNGNYVQNSGSVTGHDEGVAVDGTDNWIQNYGSITGQNGDGVDIYGDGFGGLNYNEVDNYGGSITGYWQGVDNANGGLVVDNAEGGSIIGQHSDGIRSNVNGESLYTDVYNYSVVSGEGTVVDQGLIQGATNGISVGGEGLYVENGYGSLITGLNGDGIHMTSTYNEIWNDGTIQGSQNGIAEISSGEGAGHNTYVYNAGTITGANAGYLFDGSDAENNSVVQIDNHGVIEVTGNGTLPTPVADEEDNAVNTDMINGEGAAPVAAVDARASAAGDTVIVFNWGQINGANVFSDPVLGEDGEVVTPAQQTTNRFAVLGGAGNEYVANFAGGVINGDIATQGGDDVLAMETGSTLNGNVDLGQTLTTGVQVLTEGEDGTYSFTNATKATDAGVDAVVLFGTGQGAYNGDITEAEVLYVDDRITQGFITSLAPNGVQVMALPSTPIAENQPGPAGTWDLNGNVTVDGTYLFKDVAIDTDGDGVTDGDPVRLAYATLGTVVNNGRLNVGGSVEVFTTTGEGEDAVTTSTYVPQTAAVLTSPVVDVWSGGVIGGHGTIVTNPGAFGGNGGVNLNGAVQGASSYTYGVDPEHTTTIPLADESRGGLLINDAGVTHDFVTQDEDGTVTANRPDGHDDFDIVTGEDDVTTTVPRLYVHDDHGNVYQDLKLPTGFIAETFDGGAFDLATDTPRYAVMAPGDEINRIGTLTVYGNVTMTDKVTGTTTYVVAAPTDDDPDATAEVTGRSVVTNWGSEFQADLKADGTGDQLLVKKTGTTTAVTGGTVDTKGPGTVDLITQNAETGAQTEGKGDGVPDFDIVDGEAVNRMVAGAGGPDGIADGVEYKASTVLDGHVTVAGRLDVRLDGEFVDQVHNNESPTIPSTDTGCGDDADGADSCAPVTNPNYAGADGIADVNAKGEATPTADFSKNAKVWDIIVAEGGVTGKFTDIGFDGGANDGAVVIRYAVADDPTTTDVDESVTEERVQLLKAYLQYLPDRVRIISIPDFEPKGTTINQQATGAYIDSLTQYGLHEDALSLVAAYLGTSTDIPAALDALHPEWYNAFNEVGISIARGAEQQAYIRTIEAQGFSGGEGQRVVMHIGDKSAVGSSAQDKRASFWLAGSWSNSHIDSNEGWLEYKYDTLTGYAGFDYLVTPNLLVGILGGFGNTDVDARNGTKHGDVDHWQVGGYASYFTQSWFFNAGGGIGDMNIESIRNIDFGSGIGSVSEVANAKYDGDITYFYGKGGYSFGLGDSGWKLSPELGLSYVKVKQDAFSETGTGNFSYILLNVDKQSVDSVRGTAQLRLSKTFMGGNGGGWMPYVRVGIANEFKDNLRPITSGFQGAPGTSFTVYGDVPRGTTAIFGAGITGKVSESFSLYLDYSGEIGSDFSEHTISGGARFHF